MSSLNLEKAKVIGFFSLPSSSLAESSPEAFNKAWANAPAGAGTCALCGTGILHHIVIEIDSARYFIGQDCALRVGSPSVVRCTKERMTAEEMTAKEAKETERSAKFAESERLHAAKIEERMASLGDIIKPLEESNNSFYCSLGAQLRQAPLSEKQANYVCKALIGRLTKKTDLQWNEMHNRCCGY